MAIAGLQRVLIIGLRGGAFVGNGDAAELLARDWGAGAVCVASLSLANGGVVGVVVAVLLNFIVVAVSLL